MRGHDCGHEIGPGPHRCGACQKLNQNRMHLVPVCTTREVCEYDPCSVNLKKTPALRAYTTATVAVPQLICTYM